MTPRPWTHDSAMFSMPSALALTPSKRAHGSTPALGSTPTDAPPPRPRSSSSLEPPPVELSGHSPQRSAIVGPTSGLERRQPRLADRRQGYLRNIEDHRDQRVVAADADQIHRALVAELGHHGIEALVADAVVAVQLGAKIVDRGLLGRQAGRALAARDLVGDLGVEAGLERELAVRVPLVLRGPEARRDQDRELVERIRQRALVAQVRAGLLHRIGQAGAVEQR